MYQYAPQWHYMPSAPGQGAMMQYMPVPSTGAAPSASSAPAPAPAPPASAAAAPASSSSTPAPAFAQGPYGQGSYMMMAPMGQAGPAPVTSGSAAPSSSMTAAAAAASTSSAGAVAPCPSFMPMPMMMGPGGEPGQSMPMYGYPGWYDPTHCLRCPSLSLRVVAAVLPQPSVCSRVCAMCHRVCFADGCLCLQACSVPAVHAPGRRCPAASCLGARARWIDPERLTMSTS